MCCCLGGLCGLFSGLVRSSTLQPQDPCSCWVQFICAGASWASCVNFAFPGSLYGCLLDCRHMSQTIWQKAGTCQAIYAVSLGLSPLTCYFLWKYVRGVLVPGGCSWLLFSWKHLLWWCDYCMVGVKSGESPWKGCDLEGGCRYWGRPWAGSCLSPFHEDLGAGWVKYAVVLGVRLTWDSPLVVALWLNLEVQFIEVVTCSQLK